MMSTSKTIVFFGSGPVAAKSLELLEQSFAIEAVITKPRPEHHKGDVPIITYAEKHNLPYYTATNSKELDSLLASKNFKSRVAILIDFGIIVSHNAINTFKLGIVNSHFSLLPRWRGADPISFAVLNGDTKTGVSLMLIDTGMDTGNIITQKALQMPKDITTPILTEKLINLSDELLKIYLPRYLSSDLKPRSQPHPNRATYSRKLTKADGIIDWNKPAIVIEREIRAFSGWPGSRTTLFNKDVLITKAHAVPSNGTPGKVEIAKNTSSISVYGSTGCICIEKLKPAGKREMTAKEFISGYSKK